MFIVAYEQYGSKHKTTTQDIRDLVDIMIGVVNNEKIENDVYNWASNATFGDTYLNQVHRFAIKCVYNTTSVYRPGDDRNKNPNIFKDQKILQRIANEITKQTGVENEFIGEDNDSLTWDFDTGISYMKNKAGNGLYFALNDDNGKEICEVMDNNTDEFIRKTVTVIKRREKSNVNRQLNGSSKVIKSNLSIKQTGNVVYVTATPNKEIIAAIKNAASAKLEWHGRIYDDGCWWIDIEISQYGNIRFWVGYEDKRSGQSNGSLYNMHRLDGELRHSCEFKVKRKVVDKLTSIYQALERAELV